MTLQELKQEHPVFFERGYKAFGTIREGIRNTETGTFYWEQRRSEPGAPRTFKVWERVYVAATCGYRLQPRGEYTHQLDAMSEMGTNRWLV